MLSQTERIKRDKYLKKHIFLGLKNLNTGFDAPSIYYFDEIDFELILERVKQVGIGIYGIEPHKINEKSGNVEFFSVTTFESYKTYPQDSSWYLDAFNQYRKSNEKLIYSASYYVPGNYF